MTHPRTEPARVWMYAAAALVVLGVALRLAYPSYVTFGGEQVESVALAWRSWSIGGTDHGLRVSTGVDMPPFYLWLLSLPVALTRDPVRITQFVMLLNVVSLAGLYFLVRARRSTAEAWFVTALCATAPWSIVFARKIWAQDVLFPFQLAFYALFLSMLVRPAPWKTWCSIVLLAVLAQIYPSAWFLLPPVLAATWLLRLRVAWRDVAIGLVLAAVVWWPYARYQIAVDFDGWRVAQATYFGGDGGGGGAGRLEMLLDHLVGTAWRAGGGGLEWLLGTTTYEEWQAYPLARASALLATAFLVPCAAAFVWAVWIVARAVRARFARASVNRPAVAAPAAILVLFALILLAVPLEYALVRAPALPHYQMVVQPALAILVVAGAFELARRHGPRVARLVPPALCAFALVHALQWASLLSHVVDRPDTIVANHGPIYASATSALDRDLAAALEEVETGAARRVEENARLAQVFARSDDVLYAYTGRDGEAPLRPVGRITIEPAPEATRFVLRAPPALVELPELPARDRGLVIVRFDVTSPAAGVMSLFYKTKSLPEYRRTQSSTQILPRGRSVQHVVLEAATLHGAIRLRLGPARCTIHSIEARALDE